MTLADEKMSVVVGSDHAGFPLKGKVIEFLEASGYQVIDVGSYDDKSVDFPDIASQLTSAILTKRADRGLMVCGTGVGAAIAANKIPGIRAAVCHDFHSAHQSVEHDDVNVMCIGAQIVGAWLALDLVDAFVRARFNATEDHKRRVRKLQEMERAASGG